jgi:putative endonuclease
VLGALLRSLRLNRPDDHWTLGERAAERKLTARGYTLLGRNVRTRAGEIDRLFEAPDGRTIVLVEVKARVVRAGDAERLPERAITAAKGRKLATLARGLARDPRFRGRPIRVDVVAVEFEPHARQPSAVRHYEHAINAAGRRA